MKAILIGYLGKDAELKNTSGGKDVTNFSVAETIGYGDKKETQWVRCVVWGERGAKISQYLLKGTQVAIFGELKMVSYETKDGVTRSALEMRVDDVKLLGKKSDGEPAPKKEAAPTSSGFGDDDDIPF